jgi:hypothetical protein
LFAGASADATPETTLLANPTAIAVHRASLLLTPTSGLTSRRRRVKRIRKLTNGDLCEGDLD